MKSKLRIAGTVITLLVSGTANSDDGITTLQFFDLHLPQCPKPVAEVDLMEMIDCGDSNKCWIYTGHEFDRLTPHIYADSLLSGDGGEPIVIRTNKYRYELELLASLGSADYKGSSAKEIKGDDLSPIEAQQVDARKYYETSDSPDVSRVIYTTPVDPLRIYHSRKH